MIRVGRINYLNTEPFFYRWPSRLDMELIPGSPRELSLAARGGLVDCAPLPLVECWRLENDFEPLNRWGISVRQAAGSVLLFSRGELPRLEAGIVGVTEETSTSVILLDVLLRMRYGLKLTLKRGFSKNDIARLLIGDAALSSGQGGLPGYPLVYDLGREWVEWQKRPFVFAQWVVRKSLPGNSKRLLREIVTDSLKRGLDSKDEIAVIWSSKLSIAPEVLRIYLDGFSYELGDPEREAMGFFRSLKEGASVR